MDRPSWCPAGSQVNRATNWYWNYSEVNRAICFTEPSLWINLGNGSTTNMYFGPNSGHVVVDHNHYYNGNLCTEEDPLCLTYQ